MEIKIDVTLDSSQEEALAFLCAIITGTDKVTDEDIQKLVKAWYNRIENNIIDDLITNGIKQAASLVAERQKQKKADQESEADVYADRMA